MACHRLLKKDIVTLCKKRGLSIGKFTKAELIVQLEEDDCSKEQIPDPNWGYSRIWEQLEREPGIAKTPVPDQTRVFTIGFPIGGSRWTGLERSLREQEDCGRQREPEKELQKQQQDELAVGERRGLGDLPGLMIMGVGDEDAVIKEKAQILIEDVIRDAKEHLRDLQEKEREAEYIIQNIQWTSCKDFTVERGQQQIEEYMSSSVLESGRLIVWCMFSRRGSFMGAGFTGQTTSRNKN
nr:A-kinase anchor protein 14 isoform X5 [Caretta caretta]